MSIKTARVLIASGEDAKGKFPWHSFRQIAGIQSALQGDINACEDGAYVTIDIKLAHSLVEICRQAKHTEKSLRSEK